MVNAKWKFLPVSFGKTTFIARSFKGSASVVTWEGGVGWNANHLPSTASYPKMPEAARPGQANQELNPGFLPTPALEPSSDAAAQGVC